MSLKSIGRKLDFMLSLEFLQVLISISQKMSAVREILTLTSVMTIVVREKNRMPV